MNGRRALSVALLLTGLGCAAGQPVATTPVTPTPVPPSESVTPGPTVSALEGEARFPAEMAAVIPTGIGQVIPTGIGSYRVQQAAADLPVPGATVTARDPVTRAALPVAATRTDAEGRFRLEGVGVGENVVIEVSFKAADGSRDFRLLALGRAGEPVAVSWRSTSVVAALLASPGSQDLRQVDLAPLRAAEATRQAEAEALAPEAREALLGGLLTAVAPTAENVLPLPSVAPLPVVSALPSILPSTGILDGVPDTVSSILPDSTIDSILPGPTPAPSASPSSGLVSTVTEVVEDTTDLLPLPSPSLKLPKLF